MTSFAFVARAGALPLPAHFGRAGKPAPLLRQIWPFEKSTRIKERPPKGGRSAHKAPQCGAFRDLDTAVGGAPFHWITPLWVHLGFPKAHCFKGCKQFLAAVVQSLTTTSRVSPSDGYLLARGPGYHANMSCIRKFYCQNLRRLNKEEHWQDGTSQV